MSNIVSYQNDDITRAEILESTDELFLYKDDPSLFAVDHTAETIYKFAPEGFKLPKFKITTPVEDAEGFEDEDIVTSVIEIDYGMYKSYQENPEFVSITPRPEFATATEYELEELIDVELDVNIREHY